MTFPVLESGKILLFFADAASLDDQASTLADRWFDKDERQRHDAFRFDQDRHLFLASHLLMRRILGHYAETSPERLEFVRNEFGKPALTSHSSIQFSLSHSGHLALLAISRGIPLGADIEVANTTQHLDETILRFFSQTEQDQFQRLEPSEKHRCLFELWTLKESVVKATGQGLSLGLDQFSINFSQEGKPQLCRQGNNLGRTEDWSIERIQHTLGNGIYVAVAAWQRYGRFNPLEYESYLIELGEFVATPMPTSGNEAN